MHRIDRITRIVYETEVEAALDAFEAKWGGKYPTIVKQWRQNWSDIIAMFEFSE